MAFEVQEFHRVSCIPQPCRVFDGAKDRYPESFDIRFQEPIANVLCATNGF